MKTFVSQFVSEEEKELFAEIKNTVSSLPDIDLGLDENQQPILLSCHMLARAIGNVYGLECKDGYFNPNFEHSWLITPDKHIIDVYPVGILGGPILVDGINKVAKYLYTTTSAKKLSQGRFDSKPFRRSVKRITTIVRKIQRELRRDKKEPKLL